jgi:hypothetical protein
MNSFITTIEKAYTDYNSGNVSDVGITLKSAFDFLLEAEKIQLDENLYNALYDALELTEMLIQPAVFEKNDYLKNNILHFKNALNAFLLPQNGSVLDLTEAIFAFTEVLNGLAVALMYLNRRKLKLADFPPEVSFELTENGFIKLYVWSDEGADKIANLQSLREEFDALFEKEQKTADDLLKLAANYFENEDYESCLSALNRLHSVSESSRAICFLKKSEVYLKLNRYGEAVDAMMKSKVLGIPQNEFSDKLKFAVNQLIRQADSYAERKKWTEFHNEYCP